MTAMFPGQQQAAPEVLARDSPQGQWHVALTVLALVLGGLAGFFVGRATAPVETVTKTVEARASAYAIGSPVNATVVFDGSTASYSGPAEMTAGTVANFAFKAKENALLAVGRVDPGVTWEKASAYTSTEQPDWLSDVRTADSRLFYDVARVWMTEGVYLVVVFADHAYVATMIRVTR